MSIRVYLRGDEVQKLPGFTTKPRRDHGQEWNEYELPGLKLSHDNGRWHIPLSEPTEPVPAAVADIVEEISFYGQIPLFPRRERGIYRHESAEAEVESTGYKDGRIGVRIQAKNMEDLLHLYRKIKDGSIRPEQSFEGQQGGLSHAELEAELERTRQGANSTLESMELEKLKLESLKNDLRTFYHELRNGWPFRRTETIRLVIKEVLDRHA